MKPFASYVICTSPRSGSTLLCSLLQSVGKAGFPDSHFHHPSLKEWLGYYDLSPDDYTSREDTLRAVFNAAHQFGMGKSAVFGLRMQRHSYRFFAEQLRLLHPSLPNDSARLEAVFGKTLFIYLTRENKLEQAISFVKAKQSGLWHKAPDGTEIERLSAPRELVYDREAIAGQLAAFELMDAEWEDWFAKEEINPLRVTYDELSAAPYYTLARVLDALGLEPGACVETTPPIAKLADATNLEWANRFRVDAQSASFGEDRENPEFSRQIEPKTRSE